MPKGSAHCTTPASSSPRLVEWKPFRNECNKVSLFVKAFFVRHDAQYYKAHSNCATCINDMFPQRIHESTSSWYCYEKWTSDPSHLIRFVKEFMVKNANFMFLGFFARKFIIVSECISTSVQLLGGLKNCTHKWQKKLASKYCIFYSLFSLFSFSQTTRINLRQSYHG